MPHALIDTDPGIDDALALLLAWGSPEWTVDVVTVVAGNVPLDAGTLNVFRLLDLRRPSPPPLVATGASRPLTRPLRTAAYHGADGLGDLGDWPRLEPRVASTDAAGVIVDAARRHGPDLTLVALGPVTNLALAVERDAAAVRGAGRVVAMGGAVDVPGNVTPDAEFNAHVDPEALARVLAAGVRVDLVPLDVTRRTTLTRGALESVLRRGPAAFADRVRRFTDYAFGMDERHGRPGMDMHDPLAVGVALDPTLVEWEAARLAIGPDGQTRRGTGEPNARFARAVDAPRFLAMFLDRLCPRS
ncbi:MAG TPA: nucleoside hydrolase [Methylomirabilota bacterium]|jgi:purine nucleosidase/pyrimidine-specific ribonucleoside hydrolase|nr:nucleoside hydrolase [Methylomirabilota bacterium]